MNPSSCFFRPALILTLLLLTGPAAHPAEPADAQPLVITNGIFSVNGQETPATLRNLVPLLNKLYPTSNITVVGADDVAIENLTLQWRKRDANEVLWGEHQRAPLMGVLMALSAASGHKFRVQDFGPIDFLLTSNDDPSRAQRRSIEIFNVSRILGGQVDAGLENGIRALEAAVAVLSNRYGLGNPRVTEPQEQLEILKAQRARQEPRSSGDDIARLDQIKDVIHQTLQQLKPGSKVPEFEFHPGTHLLIVIGSDDAIDIARKVIAAMEKNS